MQNIYGVILCGGKGERLWPYSTPDRPKQFLPIGDKTLLQHAIGRCSLFSNETWVVSELSNKKHLTDPVDRIILEPVGKNTAPAALLGCLELYEKNPDAIAVFLPADSSALFFSASFMAINPCRVLVSNIRRKRPTSMPRKTSR